MALRQATYKRNKCLYLLKVNKTILELNTSLLFKIWSNRYSTLGIFPQHELLLINIVTIQTKRYSKLMSNYDLSHMFLKYSTQPQTKTFCMLWKYLYKESISFNCQRYEFKVHTINFTTMAYWRKLFTIAFMNSC